MKNHILHTGKVGPTTSTGGTQRPGNRNPKKSMEPGSRDQKYSNEIRDPRPQKWELERRAPKVKPGTCILHLHSHVFCT